MMVEEVRAWGVTAEELARGIRWVADMYWLANLVEYGSLDPVERTRAGAT